VICFLDTVTPASFRFIWADLIWGEIVENLNIKFSFLPVFGLLQERRFLKDIGHLLLGKGRRMIRDTLAAIEIMVNEKFDVRTKN
jgi:hypothetical protein